MEKVYAYLRVSTIGQVEGDGFDRQLEAITRYCETHGMTLAGVFREEGVSGTREHRPALAEMIVTLEENGHGVEKVVIEKLDRLARDLMIQEAIIRDFQGRGFQLVSTMEGPDLASNDPTRKLIRQIFGAVAEYEKQMLVAKLHAARMRKRKKTGKCEGRKSYREVNSPVIPLIHHLRKKPKGGRRMSWRGVAEELNRRGIPTMDNRLWTLHRVYQVYHNL